MLTSGLWVKLCTETTHKTNNPHPPKASVNKTCFFIAEEKVAGHAANISRHVLCSITN